MAVGRPRASISSSRRASPTQRGPASAPTRRAPWPSSPSATGWGPPELAVVFRPGLIAATGESIAAASRGRIFINTTFVSAVDAGVIAHEYFHTLQHDLGRRSLGLATDPWWMREGAATYAAHRYVRVAVDGLDAEAPHPGPSGLTYDLVRLNRLGAPALAEVERPVPFYRDAPITYSLGLLAVDWLVDHSSEEAVVDYYRRLADEDSWQRAFEAAFGIAVEDFQQRFAAYRAVVFPPLPHLTDDSLDPVVVVVGDASPEQEAAARSRFADLQAFGERFGGGRAHLTVYIGDAESLEPVYRRFYVSSTPSRACSAGEGGFLILEPDCPERNPLAVIVPYLQALRGQLAPGSAVPQIAGDHERLGAVLAAPRHRGPYPGRLPGRDGIGRCGGAARAADRDGATHGRAARRHRHRGGCGGPRQRAVAGPLRPRRRAARGTCRRGGAPRLLPADAGLGELA